MNVLITLTTAGADTGPFNLYSNTDSYVTAFQTNIAKSLLVAGYTSTVVPAGTTTVRVKSTGLCTTYVDLFITGPGTTTTTTTAPVGPTTTTTTTAGGSPTTTTTTTSGGSPTTTTTTTGGGSPTTTTTTTNILVSCEEWRNDTLEEATITYTPCGSGTPVSGYALASTSSVCAVYGSITVTVGGPLTLVGSCSAPATTTTTTTSLVQQWYEITNCSTLATTTTAAYSVGQFAINDRVNDLSSNVYTITATYSSNPGGAGLFIGSLGATGCPSGTTTTTTLAPSVATNILVVADTVPGSDLDCLGTLYARSITTATATLYNQYGGTMNAASTITVTVNTTYNPCYGGSVPTTYNITINAGASSGSVNWDSSRTVDCGASNCVLETDTYDCAASNTASLPFRAGTVTC
jgi:hypothetical protein